MFIKQKNTEIVISEVPTHLSSCAHLGTNVLDDDVLDLAGGQQRRHPIPLTRTPRMLQLRDVNARDLARAQNANFAVRYTKSLTVGKKKKTISNVEYELTSWTYGETKWLVVIVKYQLGFSRRKTFCIQKVSTFR